MPTTLRTVDTSGSGSRKEVEPCDPPRKRGPNCKCDENGKIEERKSNALLSKEA